MGKSHSVICKTVLVFAAVAIVTNLLCFTADAGLAVDPAVPSPAPAPAPLVQLLDCYHTAVPADCDACCLQTGHSGGGYVKGDVCICNSG